MARKIVTRELTGDARHITLSAADELDARLTDLKEHLANCGELRAAATAAHRSLPPLIEMQRDTAAVLAAAVHSSQTERSDAKEALRTTIDVAGGHADRETAIQGQGRKLDELYVKRLRDRLATDEGTSREAQKVATAAATALRTFGIEIDKTRDALLTPSMDLSIQEIMNIENTKTQWRAKGANMMKEIRAFYLRLIEREQTEEQIALEPVIVALAAEVRDMTPAKLAARNGNRQPTTTDDDRSIAIELLHRCERMRVARLPEWLNVAAWLHGQLREVFSLLCGWHGRYVSYAEFSQRRASGAGEDVYSIHPMWMFRAHPSTPDSKRGA